MTSLGDARYVLLTTFRRSGVGVPTAVWVVSDGADLLVTTREGSGKVKRVRLGGAVTLVECDIRGVVAPDTVPVSGLAVVDTDAATRARLEALLEAKYGERYHHMRAAASALPEPPVSVALRITL